MTRTYFYDYRGILAIPAHDRDTADMHAYAQLLEDAEVTYTGSEEFQEEETNEPRET